MTWRANRQFIIFLIYFFVISIPIILMALFFLTKENTCFDKVQNGDEIGIDCGGTCSLQCLGTYKNPKIIFSRALKVSENKYNIFALLENYNKDVYFPLIPYSISGYNASGTLLLTASGTTNIFQSTQGVIFIPNVSMKQTPRIIDLNLGDYKGFKSVENEVKTNVQTGAWKNQRISGNNLQVVAELKNTGIKGVSAIEVYAMLYDDTKTVYAVGKTFVSSLAGRTNSAVVFTWGNIKDPTKIDFIISEKK